MYAIRTAKNFLSQNALKSLYYALIHSHLIYGIQIWGGAANKYVNEIVLIQKKAIRIICNAKYNSHTEPLFKNKKILPFHDLFSFFKLLFIGSCTTMLTMHCPSPSIMCGLQMKKEEITRKVLA